MERQKQNANQLPHEEPILFSSPKKNEKVLKCYGKPHPFMEAGSTYGGVTLEESIQSVLQGLREGNLALGVGTTL